MKRVAYDWNRIQFSISLLILLFLISTTSASDTFPRLYTCNSNKQCRPAAPNDTFQESFEVCRLLCNQYASVWPAPNIEGGASMIAGTKKCPVDTDPARIAISQNSNIPAIFNNMTQTALFDFLAQTWPNFLSSLPSLTINVQISSKSTAFSLGMDEAYNITIVSTNCSLITVKIDAGTVFGARHALVTLTQLMAYDEKTNNVVISVNTTIMNDRPAFTYRGLSFDTSRHFYPVEAIKRIITGMSYVKMNRFHWHITDSQSWPLVVESVPQMTQYGAYSSEQMHGIEVIPEIDAPGHVGESFAWDNKTGQNDSMLSCYLPNAFGPPFGYLNPLSKSLYATLGKIYADMNETFGQYSNMFHVGGDEIHFGQCWNNTDENKFAASYVEAEYGDLSDDSFHKFWASFQEQNAATLVSNYGQSPQKIIWSSSLTNSHIDLVSAGMGKDVIVEVWDYSKETAVPDLLQAGIRVIISNADALYLDCGFGLWVAEGNTWCNPYKEWQLIYNNRMDRAVYGSWNITDEQQLKNILGGEAGIWSEMIDENSVEMKVWPRLGALAERLWTNPRTCWYEANGRMQMLRHRLVTRGIRIQADPVQPMWCSQHEGQCLEDPNDWVRSTCSERYIEPTSPAPTPTPKPIDNGAVPTISQISLHIMIAFIAAFYMSRT